MSDIELFCAECGGPLIATPEQPARVSNPPVAFRVSPCSECLGKAHDEGYNDGYDEGCDQDDD